jgi:hypothetical protein
MFEEEMSGCNAILACPLSLVFQASFQGHLRLLHMGRCDSVEIKIIEASLFKTSALIVY